MQRIQPLHLPYLDIQSPTIHIGLQQRGPTEAIRGFIVRVPVVCGRFGGCVDSDGFGVVRDAVV
jgi:hypothetical protein